MSYLTPYHFKSTGFTSKNRIVLAPLTNTQSNADGTLSEAEYQWLKRRANEGFGMVISCAAHVAKDGQGWEGELGIFDDIHIPGLSSLARGIHEDSCLGIIQLFHGGARSAENVSLTQPWSASAHVITAGSKTIVVREGSIDDIQRTIQAFADAAIRASKAGLDGIELHGAHGYLLHQFTSTVTNTRMDEWGGSFENRTRLIRTVLKKIMTAVPNDFIIGVRLSPEDKYTFQGIDFDESLELARLLADEGADYIHISPWEALKRPDKYQDVDKPLITYFREKVKSDVAIMVAGGIWTAADAAKAMDAGADFVALGKVAIGVPDWLSKAHDPNFTPPYPPFTPEQLRNADVGEKFIEYLKRWKGFVTLD